MKAKLMGLLTPVVTLSLSFTICAQEVSEWTNNKVAPLTRDYYSHLEMNEGVSPDYTKKFKKNLPIEIPGIPVNITVQGEFSQADFREARLARRLFIHTNFNGADLRGADLEGTQFIGCGLKSVDFEAANLKGANFARNDLSQAGFYGANLEGANFSQTIIRDGHSTFFNYANLKNAVAQDARWPQVGLSKADLRGADFRYAWLKKVNLTGAQIEGTDFRGTNLAGADLRGLDFTKAKTDQNTIFWRAVFDKHTKLPFSRDVAINTWGMGYENGGNLIFNAGAKTHYVNMFDTELWEPDMLFPIEKIVTRHFELPGPTYPGPKKDRIQTYFYCDSNARAWFSRGED